MLSMTPFLSRSYVSRIRLATPRAPSRSVSPELISMALLELLVGPCVLLAYEVKVF